MSTLLKTTEVYRVDTESQAEELINSMKEKANDEGYILLSYKSTLKEKKAKGELVDSGLEVVLTKEFSKFWEV